MKVFWMWNSGYSPRRWIAKAATPTSGERLCANSEIAWWYAQALSAEFGLENVVHLSMGDEFTRDAGGKLMRQIHGVEVHDDDFFIGHLGPWAGQAHELGLRYIPMVAWPNKMAWPYAKFVYHEQHQAILDQAPLLIPLCGPEVWEASKHDAMLSRWRGKGQQLQLGFSRDLFPHVKCSFNPPGKRGFLYVGQVSQQKGTGPLLEVFQKLGYELHVGNGEWSQAPGAYGPSIHVHGWVDNADYAFWEELAPKVDFMVCPTLWDCQPVSPMECLSRGFPVIGTRWASMPAAVLLKDDLSDLEKVLRQCQEAPDHAVDLAQRVQLSWMDHELDWNPVLGRFREIICNHLGRRGA
jgi:glycosyltransferase involved in cell wall biosynthesis